jgi:hypothetical protein
LVGMGSLTLVRWLSFSFRLREVAWPHAVACFVLFPLCVSFGLHVVVNGIVCATRCVVFVILGKGVCFTGPDYT